jgi:hypothetical protein
MKFGRVSRFKKNWKERERERQKKRKGSVNAKIGKFQAFFCGGFDPTLAKRSKRNGL